MNRSRLVIGLVGKVASGKSTVARIFRDKYNFTVLDVDKFGHNALEIEKNKLVEEFGEQILDSQGNIDRKVLGNIVFNDTSKLSRLTSIVHPRMKKEIYDIIRNHPNQNYIIDAAILFEMGLDYLCDFIVLVDAPIDMLKERIRKYRQWEPSRIDSVLQAQQYIDFFRKQVNYLIFNNKNQLKLEKQVEFFMLTVS